MTRRTNVRRNGFVCRWSSDGSMNECVMVETRATQLVQVSGAYTPTVGDRNDLLSCDQSSNGGRVRCGFCAEASRTMPLTTTSMLQPATRTKKPLFPLAIIRIAFKRIVAIEADEMPELSQSKVRCLVLPSLRTERRSGWVHLILLCRGLFNRHLFA